VLSPFVRLAPGESYSWRYEWFATNIGGDLPVVGCNDAGVIAEPMRARRTASGWRLTGRFGVFASSTPHIEWRDANGRVLGKSPLAAKATPVEALTLDAISPAPDGACKAAIVAGNEVASVKLEATGAPGQPPPAKPTDAVDGGPRSALVTKSASVVVVLDNCR
jgi:hypothetical protein